LREGHSGVQLAIARVIAVGLVERDAVDDDVARFDDGLGELAQLADDVAGGEDRGDRDLVAAHAERVDGLEELLVEWERRLAARARGGLPAREGRDRGGLSEPLAR